MLVELLVQPELWRQQVEITYPIEAFRPLVVELIVTLVPVAIVIAQVIVIRPELELEQLEQLEV